VRSSTSIRDYVGPSVRPLVDPSVGPHITSKTGYVAIASRRKRKSADVENWLPRNFFAPGVFGCPFLLNVKTKIHLFSTLREQLMVVKSKPLRGSEACEGIDLNIVQGVLTPMAVSIFIF
jgi:hypothetical protein